MRPVPACRSHGPHPLTIKQRLEALGYAVGPSPLSGRRRIAHGGVEVGHLTVEQACGLLPRPAAPDVSAEALLADIAARIDALPHA